MEVSKATGTPLLEGWTNGLEFPHTVTTAVTYRLRLNALNELPEDKRPPRNLWDKPYRLSQFFDQMFETKGKASTTQYVNIDDNFEDVE